MKVSQDDIRKIKTGTSVTFTVSHPREINTVKTMAYQLHAHEPELRKRFSCKSDFRNRQITVTANPV